MQPFTTCLWFDGNAEEAVDFYLSVFRDGRVTKVFRWAPGMEPKTGKPETGAPKAGEPPVLTVEFELNGQHFLALNGGPQFKFTEAFSLVVNCESQAEVDHYWNALLAGGGSESQCGWLKDRFGLSWQVTPTLLLKLIEDPNPKKAGAVMQAMLSMVKLDSKALQAAYDKA